jgi:hypothetical protein
VAALSDLDEALERFALTGLEYAGGLANHGPMAAEALDQLGHAALIPGLVGVYAPRLPPLERGLPIPADERDAALGRHDRLPDWVATFEVEIANAPWTEVVRLWVERLLPGAFAGAAHGLLRVSHAVRALETKDTAPRRRELALGLAYWAGRHQRLPGEPGSAARADRGPRESFARLEVVPDARRRPGFFYESVEVLVELPEFGRSVDRIDLVSARPSLLLHEICQVAAELYLANPQARIAY